MKRTRTTYSHRGDRLRRHARIRKGLLVLALIGAIALIPRERPGEAQASTDGFSFGLTADARRLRSDLDATRDELHDARAQLERANAILRFSSRYKVGADVATPIYDLALEEGIDPDLAFRLVKVESQFNARAVSSAGAVGLTQLEPATARWFVRDTSREALMEPRTNLRIGFRYLRTLIEEYRGDVQVALLVYNRGPLTVQSMRLLGQDPRNGYEAAVMRGYRGKGTLD
jgi:soluble lytic murein transglycosylase-like protein